MGIKNWLREYLGIAEVGRRLYSTELLLTRMSAELGRRQDAHSEMLRVQCQALGRIITRIDPQYGRDETDPQRRAESDALGKEVIEKLWAEDAARNPGRRRI